jgi:DNA repair exonuclease SbcCD ATPase subunit
VVTEPVRASGAIPFADVDDEASTFGFGAPPTPERAPRAYAVEVAPEATSAVEDDLRASLERAEREGKAVKDELATVKSELAVVRRSREELKTALTRAESERELAQASATQSASVEVHEIRQALESRAKIAEEARMNAEKLLEEARNATRDALETRAALELECERLRKEKIEVQGNENAVVALREERDVAMRANESASARLRTVERMLEESREEQFASAEELSTLRRAIHELREERGMHRDENVITSSREDDNSESRRGQFFTEAEIAVQEEEKYIMLAELQDERRRRQEIQAELEELVQTQDAMNERAESASRVAAVAEGEADDYREKMSKVQKATRAAEHKLEEVARRAEQAERVIIAIKAEIQDTTSGNDDGLPARVRKFIERSNRKTAASLSEALEELQLLHSKAKDMNNDKTVHEANADERVTKLVEVRDRLVEEMNAQTLELERLDEEIIQRVAAHDATRAEISTFEEKLASAQAQNARLIEIIEEQGQWVASENTKPHVTASAPVTPVKSMSRHVDRQRRERGDLLAAGALGYKPMLASIEARLLEIQNM